MATYTGKVRDVYDLGNDYYLLDASDRLSCFDRQVGNIPGKGKLLNQMSAFMFEHTSHLAPNHMISVKDSKMLVKKCRPFKVEMIVREYITGSLWRLYEAGARDYCGVALPDGLKKNQKLPHPILTPTTKDDVDEPISMEEIVSSGRMTEQELYVARNYALKLFEHGSNIALKAGFILVDTKFEFGEDVNGDVIVIDELMTCDSSRYWDEASYHGRFIEGLDPRKFDKDCVRDWLLETMDNVKLDPIPEVPEEIIQKALHGYQSFHTCISQIEITEESRVVILSGSKSDAEHVDGIAEWCQKYKLKTDQYVASAHKSTLKVLDLIKSYDNNPNFSKVIYVTVAGRSNALSGVVAANSSSVVIACPPFKDKVDMMVNLGSSIQCPSNVPVMTILEPSNVALAIHRMVGGC
jgi:phosphoribosylaminoimidazole-succinocarboxamide synthase